MTTAKEHLNKMQEIRERTSLYARNLKDGESITGVFVGDGYMFSAKFDKGWYPAAEDDADARPVMFHAFYDDKFQNLKIITLGYNQLVDIADALDEYKGSLVRITRTGSGASTSYKVIFCKEDPNKSAAKAKTCKMLPLKDIAHASTEARAKFSPTYPANG